LFLHFSSYKVIMSDADADLKRKKICTSGGSGAAKRKCKLEVESKIAKLPKVTSFFTLQRNTEVIEPTDVSAGPSSSELNVSQNVQQDYEHSDTDATNVVQDEADVSHGDDDLLVSGDEQQEHVPTQMDIDMGNFIDSELTSEQKMFIVRNGPCQPSAPFPVEVESKRCFSEQYYKQVSKCGIEVKREWLCYSPKLDKVYCQPCWLFADRCSGIGSHTFISGYNDWRHLSRTVKVHQESKAHLEACKIAYTKIGELIRRLMMR
jgi:hypothetical protein